MGGLFGAEAGPERVGQLMAIYGDALRTAPGGKAAPGCRAALMTAGFCHEDARVVAARGTELVGWYIEQQRERARLVWRDYDPSTVPADYRGYYERDQRLARGPHQANQHPRKYARKAKHSALAHRRNASAFSKFTRRLASRKCSCCARSARRGMRRCATPFASSASRSFRILAPSKLACPPPSEELRRGALSCQPMTVLRGSLWKRDSPPNLDDRRWWRYCVHGPTGMGELHSRSRGFRTSNSARLQPDRRGG